jgi:hypothetical protein
MDQSKTNNHQVFAGTKVVASVARLPLYFESIFFLPFQPEEIARVGIQPPAQTPGDLMCGYANALHHDMKATDAQLEQLCTNLVNAGRETGRCTSGLMKEAEKLAFAEKCKAAPNVAKCQVTGCPPGDPAAMTQGGP